VVGLAYGVVFTGASLTGHSQQQNIVATAAAKQLDATSTSGGPTAEQNQKIQELTFNHSYVALKIEGIDGESTDEKHTVLIEIF
jgi:hypothetical protein